MKDDEISAKQVAHAEMARGKLLRMQAYLQRGRGLETTSDADLREVWISSFRDWSKDLRHRPPIHDDAEAELELRGQPVPYDAVEDEMKSLIAAADSVYMKMTDEEKQRANEDMYSNYREDKKNEN